MLLTTSTATKIIIIKTTKHHLKSAVKQTSRWLSLFQATVGWKLLQRCTSVDHYTLITHAPHALQHVSIIKTPVYSACEKPMCILWLFVFCGLSVHRDGIILPVFFSSSFFHLVSSACTISLMTCLSMPMLMPTSLWYTIKKFEDKSIEMI